MKRGAVMSIDQAYRYQLTRRWGDDEASVTWVMLNPSTADADVDDPTIRRCIGFSRSWGFDALTVVNLFAYRATDPKALALADEPVGQVNYRHVREAIEDSAGVVCAWGAHARKVRQFPYTPDVRDLAARCRVPVFCLGTTKAGDPRHPLYLAADTPLITYLGGPDGR